MKEWKRILLAALVISIGARFYVNFLVDGFIITVSVILLFLTLYYFREIDPLKLGITVALLSPLMRFGFLLAFGETVHHAWMLVYPDVFFYLSYGLFFHLLTRRFAPSGEQFIAGGFFADLFSNIVEISVRVGIDGLSDHVINTLFTVAAGRTLLILVIIGALGWYRSMLKEEEHGNRYRHLVLLASTFKSEIYFLEKNAAQIEHVMTLAYEANRQSKGNEPLERTTLQLAKEVHEVKKDYVRAIQGLEALYDKRVDLLKMRLSDLLKILQDNTIEMSEERATLSLDHQGDVWVREHFYLMSVLRNLVNNALEAGEGRIPRVWIRTSIEGEKLVIEVEDDGTGIEEQVLPYAFNLGFSTKFNEETGDVYRGMGLTLTKEFVEDIYRGAIEIQSQVGRGTVFRLHLPIERGAEEHELLFVGR